MDTNNHNSSQPQRVRSKTKSRSNNRGHNRQVEREGVNSNYLLGAAVVGVGGYLAYKYWWLPKQSAAAAAAAATNEIIVPVKPILPASAAMPNLPAASSDNTNTVVTDNTQDQQGQAANDQRPNIPCQPMYNLFFTQPFYFVMAQSKGTNETNQTWFRDKKSLMGII